MSTPPPVTLTHLGWSGFKIEYPGNAALYVDPPTAAGLPFDQRANILITHGHPEHLTGAIEYLRRPGRTSPLTLAASPNVCRYLRRWATPNLDELTSCRSSQHITVAGFALDVFHWRHMPLLPPGLAAAAGRLRRLMSRPGLATRIIAMGLRGPLPFPMLGFRIAAPGGPRILVYGEGLHRHTQQTSVKELSTRLPADVLLVAVEPEDTDALPHLIGATGVTTVGLYEAHRPWRDAFSMPHADLAALGVVLESHGKRAMVFRPGTTMSVH